MDIPEFDQETLDQIDLMMDFVNFTVKIQDLIEEGYTELWCRDPLTGRQKRIWIISTPT